MPMRDLLLSVVVPVHNVESYLRQCLDSMLEDHGDDIEVIAVDDCSPDGSAAVLRGYAARDSRVRVLSLPVNVGLGLARNAGLDLARGRYVWFVDSDDWLPPGTVGAVRDQLLAFEPDVLLVDHDRVYETGRVERDASSELLRGLGGVVTLEGRPQLLGLQHTAWNKIVRTGLLRDHDLRFPPGWYEDYPFSHPVMLAAERIAVLDRICYRYRRGRPGAITGTRSDRHLEALDQYERLFRRLATWGPRFHTHHSRLFTLMINHLLVIAGNEDRLPARDRGRFFRRIADMYQRYRPESGFAPPPGTLGLRYRLVRNNAYPAYAVLRQAQRSLAKR